MEKEKKNEKTDKVNESINIAFTKEQLLRSKHFSGKSDVLNAVLSADKTYTVDETQKAINEYMKGQVK